MKKIYGIAGSAGSGKDTFYRIANKILAEKGLSSIRFSFGDFIKQELHSFILSQYNIDILSCSREEKNSIRSIIIEHGRIRRRLTNGSAYYGQLNKYIQENKSLLSNYDYSFITDVRFKEYPFDEVDYVKSIGGKIIYLTKIDEHGKKIQPIIPAEMENDPKLIASAEYYLEWPDNLSDSECEVYIKNFFSHIKNGN